MAKVPECDMGVRTPWTQAGVTARWAAIGNPGGVAPLLPKTMEGWYTIATRGPRMLALSPTGSLKKSSLRSVTKEENKFLNVYNAVACDPYRKQSGISKVAGKALQVASFVVPVVGQAMFAVAEAGNAALSMEKAKTLTKDATQLLTQAATQAAEAAYQPAPAAPAALVAPVSSLVPQPAGARGTVSQVTLKPGSRWTARDFAIAGVLATGLYLLVRRIQR